MSNRNEELIQRVRDVLAKRGTRGIAALGRWFVIADTDRSRSLDFDEFVVIMHRMRLGLDEADTRQLFQYFDRDGGGTVSYDEFLQRLRGQINEARRSIILKAFAVLDTDGNGTVDFDEVCQKYSAKGHPAVKAGKKTEEEVILEFLDTFWAKYAHSANRGEDTGKHDGSSFRLTRDEFIEYYKDVSASIDRDDYFELMMNSAWRLGEYAKYSNKAKGTALEVGGGPARGQAPSRLAAPAPQAATRGLPAGIGAAGSQQRSAASTPQRGAASRGNDVTKRMLVERVKEVLKKRGTRGIISLGKWFLRSDLDKSGELDHEEFQIVMKRLRVGLNPDQCAILYDAFDANGSGAINYDEFLLTLRGEMGPTRLKVIDQAWGKLLKFDRNGDGQLDMDELRQIYSAKGHPDVKSGKKTEEEVLLEFIETFECGGEVDGVITHDEFVEYYRNISASFDVDAQFVQSVNSAWRMAEFDAAGWTKKGSRMEI